MSVDSKFQTYEGGFFLKTYEQPYDVFLMNIDAKRRKDPHDDDNFLQEGLQS